MKSTSAAEFRTELAAITAAIRHPLPLFLTSVVAVWAGYHTGQNTSLTLAYTLFGYLLALLAVTDLREGILPHFLTGLLATLGTILAPTLGLSYTESLLGSLVAFGGLFTCAFITEHFTGKPSLGGGDLWLTLGLGAWLGVAGLPMLLLATAVTGAISICLKRWITQDMPIMPGIKAFTPPEKSFPFGPALCAAGVIALFYSHFYWQCIEMLTKPSF
jgi:leader peptidase (prepilin peptidase)/N-methyltransferase